LGQRTISGTLADANTSQPIPYATVYVDGSSNGTTSNVDGYFQLQLHSLPCRVVISHISYQTEIVNCLAGMVSPTVFNVSLHPREINLDEVYVKDLNQRKKNLDYFRETFFGTNKWGEFAFLENDSVLFFEAKNYADHDSTRFKQQWPDEFSVVAKAPLLVKLPLLGYELFMNIEHFQVKYNPEHKQFETDCNGYTYFTSVEPDSDFKKRKIMKNRLTVYYNSRLHFYRSLYNRTLEENGYRVLEQIKWDSLDFYDYLVLNTDTCMSFGDGYAEIVGLNDKDIYLQYFYNEIGKPTNLTKREGQSYKVSKIDFLKDRCTILKNGTCPEHSIRFGSVIGDKKVGALLPDDFDPKVY
jgi:hypothetical protein